MSFIIYTDLECIIEMTDGYKNNPEKSTTTKESQHIPSDLSMSVIKVKILLKVLWIFKRARNESN